MKLSALVLSVALCAASSTAWAQQPKGDRGPASQAFKGVAARLAQDLDLEFTADPDADYASVMIAMHHGVIDMAKTEMAFGKDAELKRSAESTVKSEEAAIQSLKAWVSRKPK